MFPRFYMPPIILDDSKVTGSEAREIEDATLNRVILVRDSREVRAGIEAAAPCLIERVPHRRRHGRKLTPRVSLAGRRLMQVRRLMTPDWMNEANERFIREITQGMEE